MDVQELLDAAKAASGTSTDGELAKRLGISKQAMSSYRGGVRLPDPVTCATLAGLTGIPLAKVLGVVGEARAISREEKAVWRKLAATAVSLFIVIGSTNYAKSKTSEKPQKHDYVLNDVPVNVYYVKKPKGFGRAPSTGRICRPASAASMVKSFAAAACNSV